MTHNTFFTGIMYTHTHAMHYIWYICESMTEAYIAIQQALNGHRLYTGTHF